MKILTYLALAFIGSGCVIAQPEITGAPWKVTSNVVDENNQPVAGASVSVSYFGKPLPGQVVEDARELIRQITGQTDVNGTFIASHSDASLDIGIDVQKAGYYSSHRSWH